MRKLLLVALLLGIVTFTGCYASAGNGNIAVRRASGPIEGKTGIKEIICPGKRVGNWNDDIHTYPDSSSQRTFKFNADEDADAGAIEGLRTSDGYKVTLQGTVYFKTAFDCSKRGQQLLKKFDNANASRPEGQRPWEDWSGYLQNQWKPILDSTARNALLGFKVEQVLSSAALLSGDQKKADEALEGVDNKSNILAIEKALSDGFKSQLRSKLGDDYFTDITFNMEQPSLPDIDQAIAQAQTAFAKVADVRAERKKQEELVRVEQEKRNVAAERAKGYAKCGSCARQDEIKAFGKSLPDSLTTLILDGKSNYLVK